MKNHLYVIMLALFCAGASFAQEPEADPGTLPPETAAQFDALLEEITEQKAEVEALTARAAGLEGYAAELTLERRDSVWVSMFRNTMDLAEQVAAEMEAGRDVAVYREPLAADLQTLPEELEGMIDRVAERAGTPIEEGEVYTQVIADQVFFRELDNLHSLYSAIADFVEISGSFDIDATAVRERLEGEVAEYAANLSTLLALATENLATLGASAAALPDNTQVQEMLAAATARTGLATAAMQDAVGLMDTLGLDPRPYQKQVLSVTGEITADVLDVGLIRGMVSDWGDSVTELMRSNGVQVMFRIALFIIILYVSWQLGKLAKRLLEKALNAGKVRLSHLLKKMLLSTVRNVVFFVGVLLALSQFGISLGPVLAGLGIVGFIIGFALQDTLSNFASGLMILIYRPFDVGDLVEASGVSGKVSHMSLVNTTFLTLDNQRLIVPNNLIWQNVIKNVTAQHVRRIDLVFGVSYSDDLDKVEEILADIVNSHEAVLDSPEPVIAVNELGDSSVNFVVRPWVKTDDYLETYWDLTKKVKQRFDAEGIAIPFPQRDLHIIKPDPEPA